MIIGLMLIGGLIIYLLISLFMIWISVRAARQNGKPAWKSALITAVIMYLIMFWDLIPFHVAHKYYCATEGGYTLNKTLEQWKQENPGVAETLIHKRSSDYTKTDNRERYQLNQRFAWDIYTTKHFLGIRKKDNRVLDIKTGDVLAQYVDFDSDQSSTNPDSFRDVKFWIFKNSCEPDGEKISRGEFYDFENRVFLLGSMKK